MDIVEKFGLRMSCCGSVGTTASVSLDLSVRLSASPPLPIFISPHFLPFIPFMC